MIPIFLFSENYISVLWTIVLIHDNYLSFVSTKWRIQFQLLFCYGVGVASEKMSYHSFQSFPWSFPWWCYWEHFFKCIFALTYFLSARSHRWQNEMVKLPVNFLNICKLQSTLHCPTYLIINSSSSAHYCVSWAHKWCKLYIEPMCKWRLANMLAVTGRSFRTQTWALTFTKLIPAFVVSQFYSHSIVNFSEFST